MEKEKMTNDPYAVYRHLTYQYLHYYLADFFQAHSIKKQPVIDDSGFSRSTLASLLDGKDLHFNCYLRLLTVMREYCENDDEYMDFLMGFMKRAIIEIWIIWDEKPEEWIVEIWEKMQDDKNKYSTENG